MHQIFSTAQRSDGISLEIAPLLSTKKLDKARLILPERRAYMVNHLFRWFAEPSVIHAYVL
jgi:hypothetical protein